MSYTKLNNEAVKSTELKHSALKVYTIICAHANNTTHKTLLKKKTIEREAAYSETTVRRALSTLVKQGYITVKARYDQTGAQVCNEYEVIFEAYTRRQKCRPPVGKNASPITRLNNNYNDLTNNAIFKKSKNEEYNAENIQAKSITLDELDELERGLNNNGK